MSSRIEDITYYLTAHHIYVPGTKKNLHPQFLTSHCKVKAWKTGSQDIFIIGIASLTIVQNRKVRIPFFE